jgi:hypothetical protein
MADKKSDFNDSGVRISRTRRSSKNIDREKIADRVCEFAKKDEEARSEDIELRKQRYAKFRMWSEGTGDYPWEGSSDVALTDMMTNVLSLEDTLHNAMMSNRPIVNARAMQKNNEKKQETIDDLLDTQVFLEQDGEGVIGATASAFVMDGVFTAHIPWVREDRRIVLFRTFAGLQDGEIPLLKFQDLLKQEFPRDQIVQLDEQGWDWEVTDEDDQVFRVRFYTSKDGEIEMVSRRSVRVYDGPKVIPKEYEDVLCPPRTANLQAPGPSNPGGAAHVILVDHPSIDEIQRLHKSGFYDLMTKKEAEELFNEAEAEDDDHEDVARQRDTFQGKHKIHDAQDDSHKALTRYLCFDLYDIDDDGVNTDMMWWVLKEPGILLKAKPMTEMYPVEPPRRPLAEASLIPVAGRREGIGLLEMMESMNDFKKQIFDQVVDAGTLGNLPFWFYRPTSNIKPEVMKMWPGDGMPLNDPKNDVFFPNIGAGNAQSFGINMMTIADQALEKLTVRGDLQLGRVPIGRSSALRTSQNLQSLMQAGEARPERILRRFFMGWMEIFKQIHELNQHFLPEQKVFRIAGIKAPGENPYKEITSSQDIAGRFQFDFSVNVLNASKIAQQDALEKMMGVFVSDLPIQMGITKPDAVYRLMRDWGKSHGQNVDKYLSEPNPDAMLPPILAEWALTVIVGGDLPEGPPLEGAEEHLEKLKIFAQSPAIEMLDSPDKVQLFTAYMQSVQKRIEVEKMAEAAGPIGAAPGGGAQGGSPPPDLSNPQVNENEILDETLPSAGGGGNGALQGVQ